MKYGTYFIMRVPKHVISGVPFLICAACEVRAWVVYVVVVAGATSMYLLMLLWKSSTNCGRLRDSLRPPSYSAIGQIEKGNILR